MNTLYNNIEKFFFMFKSILWSDYFERALVWSEAISSAH